MKMGYPCMISRRLRFHVSGNRGCLFLALIAMILSSSRPASAGSPLRHGEFIESFGGPPPQIEHRNPRILYDLDLAREQYLVNVPAAYTGNEPYGLIVFTYSTDQLEHVPAGWSAVLAQRKLLFVAAQKAGNNNPDNRRFGLAVLGALKMAERYKIDPQRVYAAGYSGGARMSARLAFLQSDIFHGTIQCCGTDYYQAVPQVHPKSPDTPAGPYGVYPVTPAEIESAKQNVRFVFITGSRDFRYGDMLDIYQGGFAKGGFQATLIDVPGMEHTICEGRTLAAALAFIEAKNGPAQPAAIAAAQTAIASAPATRPAPPPWLAKQPDQWPQIVLSHNVRYRDGQGWQGASGFLMKLPNGAVTGATARHVLGDSPKPAALKDVLESWTMSPRTMPERKVAIRGLAMKLQTPTPDSPDTLDCLLLETAPMRVWPVEVLIARTTAVEVGETVYLIGVAYEDKAPQRVYQGTVRRRTEGAFAFEYQATFDTRGFSGAPVLDAEGDVAGINLGHFDSESQGGKIMGSALDVCATLELATAQPAPLSTVATPSSARPATTAPADAQAAAATKKAAAALDLAKSFIKMERYDVARQRLQQIIQTYPGTPAAKEAQTLLNQIPLK